MEFKFQYLEIGIKQMSCQLLSILNLLDKLAWFIILLHNNSISTKLNFMLSLIIFLTQRLVYFCPFSIFGYVVVESKFILIKNRYRVKLLISSSKYFIYDFVISVKYILKFSSCLEEFVAPTKICYPLVEVYLISLVSQKETYF